MTAATVRIALIAIRGLLLRDSTELAIDAIDGLIDSLASEQDAPTSSARKRPLTGAERSALFRARHPNAQRRRNGARNENVTQIVAPGVAQTSSLSLTSSNQEKLKGEQEIQDLTLARSDQNAGEGAQRNETKRATKRATKRNGGIVTQETREVFEHWVAVMGMDPQRTKLTTQRASKVNARLKEGYTVDRLKAAIEGCRRSDWHMGANDDGRPQNDLEQICRSGGHVERHERHASGAVGAPRKIAADPVPLARRLLT